jgi:hypothetical protein
MGVKQGLGVYVCPVWYGSCIAESTSHIMNRVSDTEMEAQNLYHTTYVNKLKSPSLTYLDYK